MVTRNAPGRTRGFLASCMCEIAPGVYTAPRMTVGVRDRVWNVLESWHEDDAQRGILMTWQDPNRQGGQAVRTLGWPQQELWEHNGVFLTKRGGERKSTDQALPDDPVEWARSISARPDWVVLDTETTGKGRDDDVVEIAVVGSKGDVVLETLVRPDRKISPGAARVHGLTDKELRDAPAFPEVCDKVRQVVANKLVVAYNAPFDRRILRGDCGRHGGPEITAWWYCALERYQQWRDLRPTLHQACEREGIEVSTTHRAGADARLVWELVQRMAANKSDPEDR
ncbi:MAG: type I-E CRISPR-associated endoribonuclease Cas2 [bacterium]|nr:type I-E CRISPR-associated endoribonuclease Cas2 [bacterium]